MKGMLKGFNRLVVLTVILSFAILGSASGAEMKHMHSGKAAMEMHHFHMLMNHGMSMIAEGSNMAMLAEMKMAPGEDAKMIRHGQHMMNEGKGLIIKALNGPEMTAMMKHHAKDPLMDYTHQLGEAMLKVEDILEKMSMQDMSNPKMMSMHHMHMMVNHALQMAADGANLMMLGQMGMAGSVDKMSVEHGKEMMKDAKTMVEEMMSGKEMMDMMKDKSMSMENPMMAASHKHGEAAMKVIDLLSKMPSADSK
jgi:hypothetical protein